MPASADILAAFAPRGHLRASINLGNPILANLNGQGQPVGVSIDLARGLAAQLGVDIELLAFDAAGKSVAAVAAEQADVGFFAVDPLRGEGIRFTAPYLLIEGAYLVPEGSPLRTNDEVDAPGQRVVVGRNSAYDLHLTRALKHAEIVRAPTSPAVVETFVDGAYDVAAGVRQQLQADALRHPGHRLLPGRFMVIQQAMGLPKSRGEAAADYLRAYVEEKKASGYLADALARHGIQGASVAPAAA